MQQAQRTQTLLLQRTADLRRAHAEHTNAQQQVEVLRTAEAEAQSALQHARAVEQQARLNLGYATLEAPQDGTIGARSLRVGQYVQAGTQLMAIVPLRAVYVVANYKETQLTDVRPGQPVDIEVDTYPDHAVHGRVDSIAPASGQQFALLPPDNATGNFTKIVQRIPVKIVLRDDGSLGGTAASRHVGRAHHRHAPEADLQWTPTSTSRAAEPRTDSRVWLAVIGLGDRRLHRGAEHPDHQCVAARHPGRDRRRHR